MTRKPYAAFTAEELALDDLFVRWVQHPADDEVAAHWQRWLRSNPGCTYTVETARELVGTASRPGSPALSGEDTASVWVRIRASLQSLEDVRPLQPAVRTVVGWWYFFRTVAAAGALMLLAGWAVWMQYGPGQSVRTISTRAGQTRVIRLPDNSTVMLHANSSVRYAPRWYDESPRAVWLQGAGDFSVVHRSDTSSAQLFRVHLPNLTLEATGTRFRVYQWPECTRVALTSGHVSLLVNQQKPIRLQTGDSVEITAGLVQLLP